jgi:actin-related protein 8
MTKLREQQISAQVSYTPNFLQTSFPMHQNITHTKNVTSTYMSKGESKLLKLMDTEGSSSPSLEGKTTIVIHPGSSFLRIGRASDSIPYVIPHVIARKVQEVAGNGKDMKKIEKSLNESNEENRYSLIDSFIKKAMKEEKFRPNLQASQQCKSYNSNTETEIISELNDPYKIEWSDETEGSVFIGDAALKIKEREESEKSDKPFFRIKRPISNGELNIIDYSFSIQHLMCDLYDIWSFALSCINIKKEDFKDYHVILIIPDLYTESHVQLLVELLMKIFKFKGILLQQESVCAAFGAGITQACIVDVGAQKVSISCVEEGWSIPDSRIVIIFFNIRISNMVEMISQEYFMIS